MTQKIQRVQIVELFYEHGRSVKNVRRSRRVRLQEHIDLVRASVIVEPHEFSSDLI